MRAVSRLFLGLSFSVAAPLAALAGGAAAPAPHAAALQLKPGPQIISFAPRGRQVVGFPAYRRAPHGVRRDRAAGYFGGGYFGGPLVMQQGGETVRTVEVASGEYLRPRAVIYNYNGAPPLWQGDAGYVAQPAIYSVAKALGRRARVAK